MGVGVGCELTCQCGKGKDPYSMEVDWLLEARSPVGYGCSLAKIWCCFHGYKSFVG